MNILFENVENQCVLEKYDYHNDDLLSLCVQDCKDRLIEYPEIGDNDKHIESIPDCFSKVHILFDKFHFPYSIKYTENVENYNYYINGLNYLLKFHEDKNHQLIKTLKIIEYHSGYPHNQSILSNINKKIQFYLKSELFIIGSKSISSLLIIGKFTFPKISLNNTHSKSPPGYI